MNGVEILNQTNVYCEEGNIWVFLLILGFGLIVGLILAILECNDLGFNATGILCIIIGLGFCLVFGSMGYAGTIDTTDELSHVEYKVIVSDEVSFTDFMEKYEILDQEGQIYTVKERG